MSRGFVREDDQEEAPFIPPRAPLPPEVNNYVTPQGLRLLHAERESLEAERSAIQGSDDERRRQHQVIDGRLSLLNERIATARVVEPTEELDEVRFGNRVTFTLLSGPQSGSEQHFTIVGVDEASVREKRVAFISPIARALLGKRVGEEVFFMAGAEKRRLRIERIGRD